MNAGQLFMTASVAALAFGTAAPAAAQPAAAANPMAQAFASGRCSFAPPWEPGRWRLTTPADYAGETWQAFRQQTGATHPGDARGDFNGDGRPDNAVVALRDDGKWMVGVIEGGDTCETASMAEAGPSGFGHPPALITLPKAAASVACQQAGLRYAATCAVAAGAPAEWRATRPFDAIVQTDEHGTAFSGYLRQHWKNTTRADGSPLMVYGSLPIAADVRPPGK
ncbi:hypothetical protein FVQ98_07515 [Ottowia sp. GY511]|uniref:VCBS repeat-containing protein n=1 Tax=Ottowia flava TaxID=2675430 RepID=A0ABW4KMK1_9BURK|nr:hypothetical protein [Ottowia sp. GY511]TXK29731.1 hypothetical protein FVQ98_07515 [Ottowia sp. GY511]